MLELNLADVQQNERSDLGQYDPEDENLSIDLLFELEI
jgi:hypothetical protein